jgi:hypothetical protein
VTRLGYAVLRRRPSELAAAQQRFLMRLDHTPAGSPPT